ncbi:MAG: rhodanese-like domain-containing protein [Pyrinomonadaceae bacterium]
MTASELKRRLDRGDDLQIIDVREPHEYEIARISGSVLIPLAQIVVRHHEINPARETVSPLQSGRPQRQGHQRT